MCFRPDLLLFPAEVEAADAVDLERNGVALRGRVVLSAFLQRRSKRVGAHRLEEARRSRTADIADLDRDGQGAWRRGAVDRSGFSFASEGRTGTRLRIRHHVREAGR